MKKMSAERNVIEYHNKIDAETAGIFSHYNSIPWVVINASLSCFGLYYLDFLNMFEIITFLTLHAYYAQLKQYEKLWEYILSNSQQ